MAVLKCDASVIAVAGLDNDPWRDDIISIKPGLTCA